MSKSDVEQQGLSAFVLMPPHLDISFSKWWRSEELSTMVKVRMPYKRQGNAGKVSNSEKTTVYQDFIEDQLTVQVQQHIFSPSLVLFKPQNQAYLIMKSV